MPVAAFRRDRMPPRSGVDLVEFSRHRLQNLIYHSLKATRDGPEDFFGTYVTEHVGFLPVSSAYQRSKHSSGHSGSFRFQRPC